MCMSYNLTIGKIHVINHPIFNPHRPRDKKPTRWKSKKVDRSASYIAVEAIKNYIESKQHERLVIQAAIEKADKGEFVSSKAMRTWFASLGTEIELERPKPDVFLEANK